MLRGHQIFIAVVLWADQFSACRRCAGGRGNILGALPVDVFMSVYSGLSI